LRCCSERDLKEQQCHSKTGVSFYPLLGLGEVKSHWCPLSNVQLWEWCLALHGLAKILTEKKKKKEEKWEEATRPSQSCGRLRKGGNLSAHEEVVSRIWIFPQGIKKMLPSNLPSSLTEADTPCSSPSKVGSSQQEQGEWEENVSTSKKSANHRCSS